MTYTCPMHPEVASPSKGNCPKCGMPLVLKEEGKLKIHAPEYGLGKVTWRSYIPLFVIIGLILLVSAALDYRDSLSGTSSLEKLISYFMIGFFLVFGGFKLMDLKGFAEGYSTYDLLAKKVPLYGYVYPFIEIFFAFSMILFPSTTSILVAELVLMSFSGLGVALKLARKEEFQCACLGTFLKVPLTKVTIIEDFGMALLALVMLLIK